MNSKLSWLPVRRVGMISLYVIVLMAALSMVNHPTPQVAKAAIVCAAPPAGVPIGNLTPLENTLFTSGYIPESECWDPQGGLGPVFTQKDCTLCHVTPFAGGGGTTGQETDTIFATIDSAGQFDPMDGTDPNDPVNQGGILQQARSIMTLVPTCKVPGEVVPATATIIDHRLSPPSMGMGLIDSIDPQDIITQAQTEASNSQWTSMGITGVVNSVPDLTGNPTAVGKFGYKAANAMLLQFVANAMTNELGITNPIFASENCPQGNCSIPQACLKAPEPNDDGLKMAAIYQYLVYLAPWPAGTCNGGSGSNCQSGQALFTQIGCNLCHLTPQMLCGTSQTPCYTTENDVQVLEKWNMAINTWASSTFIASKALSVQPVPLYSDLLLHNMGTGDNGLSDGFCTPATPTCPFGPNVLGAQFRTTPLWGVSQRTIFLHDGRATNLTNAIQWHCSKPGTSCTGSSGSEATKVIQNFDALDATDQQSLLDFLMTL